MRVVCQLVNIYLNVALLSLKIHLENTSKEGSTHSATQNVFHWILRSFSWLNSCENTTDLSLDLSVHYAVSEHLHLTRFVHIIGSFFPMSTIENAYNQTLDAFGPEIGEALSSFKRDFGRIHQPIGHESTTPSTIIGSLWWWWLTWAAIDEQITCRCCGSKWNGITTTIVGVHVQYGAHKSTTNSSVHHPVCEHLHEFVCSKIMANFLARYCLSI